METKPFSTEWVEGFISEACDMGLSQEQAHALLKTASMLQLSKDPSFTEGFNAEMKKSAQGAWAGLAQALKGGGKALFGSGPRAAISTAALMGGGYMANNALRSRWKVSPEQGEFIRQLDSAAPGDYENIAQNWAANRESKRLNEADAIRKRYQSGVNQFGGGNRPAYMSPYF
jgi:hypothetical protein